MKHPLIGLYSPVAQSGKSTAAKQFAKLLDGVRMSFADPMREIAVPVIGEFMDGGEAEVWEWLGDERKGTKPIPQLGCTIRHALQTLGTEWGRDCIHPDVWTLIAQQRSRKLRRSRAVIIDDIRFPNEYAMVKREGGAVIRVNRPDAPPSPNAHKSERLLEHLPFDFYIENTSLEDLRRAVYDLAVGHFGAPFPADSLGEEVGL